jgi:hypothetical protein
MRRLKSTLAILAVTLLAVTALQGCAATQSGYAPGSRFCNVSSVGCMALKAQQSKTGTIAAQQGRCCS